VTYFEAAGGNLLGEPDMWTTLFAVAVAPLLISSVVAALVTCFYFACVKKEGDQIRRG
jgi:hypothetical protein